jgi:hypothetical protein
MLTALIFAASALAVEPIWVVYPEHVTIVSPIELPSMNELEIEHPVRGCRVVVSLSKEDGIQSLPSRQCPRSLFDALQATVTNAEISWETPSDKVADAVTALDINWPGDPDAPLTMRPSFALEQQYDPPAKFVGLVKKLSEDQRYCELNVRVRRHGAAELLDFGNCPDKLQKHALKALDQWSWKVPAEAPRRPPFLRVRIDYFEELTHGGETDAAVLVSHAGPYRASGGNPTPPERLSDEARKSPHCWGSAEVDASGKVTEVSFEYCHSELEEAAETAVMKWTFKPYQVRGELQGFTKPFALSFPLGD